MKLPQSLSRTSSSHLMMSTNDRLSSLKSFDDSKVGVKGIVDSGTSEIPHIFIDKDAIRGRKATGSQFSIPVIDLEDVAAEFTIRNIRDACEKWGFFQIINHGIPVHIMAEMMDGTRRFHEQDTEMKKDFYSRDISRTFFYNSNFDLYEAKSANWRDTFQCALAPQSPDPLQVPQVCRDIMLTYSNYVKDLGVVLFELLSKALGLKPNHLKDLGLAEGLLLLGHYYPPCPQPELTFGLTSHTDGGFLTILLQDEIGGLQVHHQDQWIDVPHVPDALVINVSDMLQLMSNNVFKSSVHRVIPKKIGPRISVACLFLTQPTEEGTSSPRLYGTIKELLSEENPPIYKDVTVIEYMNQLYKQGLGRSSILSHFKL